MNQKEFIKNPKYHNWVKGCLALRYLQYGLCDFVKEVAKRQHEEIKTNIELTPEKICRTCQIRSLKPHPCNPGQKPGKYVCPEGKLNCTCTRAEYKECPNKICDRMRKAIIESHESRNPTWKYIDITRCQNSPWEIQRCFLKAPGYDTKQSADETDAAGLLMLISHNTYFRKCMRCPTSLLKQIRDWRGSVLFHSRNMELEEEQLRSVIKDIKTVLQDDMELNSMECAKQALRNVEELENERFIITTEHETDVFRDCIASIQDVEKDKEEISVQKEESDLRERADNHDACLHLLNKSVAELERIKNEKDRLIRLEKEQQAHLKKIEDRQATQLNGDTINDIQPLEVNLQPKRASIDLERIIPLEILQTDKDSIALYKKALAEDAEAIHNIRVMIVGHFGVGKTTLTKRLLGQDIEIDHQESTDGIDVHVKRCKVDIKSGNWIIRQKGDERESVYRRLASILKRKRKPSPEIDNTEIQTKGESEPFLAPVQQNTATLVTEKDNPGCLKRLFRKMKLKNSSRTILSRQQQKETEPGKENLTTSNKEACFEASTESNEVAYLEATTNSNEEEFFEELAKELKQLPLEDSLNTADQSIWDFAGQYCFYDTHQV